MGNDIISMKTVKKLASLINPHIRLLINTIINTETYPLIFKVSRMTPLLKPDKITTDIASYRPINNLSTIEKLIEQYLKKMHDGIY